MYNLIDALAFGGLICSLLNYADRVRMARLARLINAIAPILPFGCHYDSPCNYCLLKAIDFRHILFEGDWYGDSMRRMDIVEVEWLSAGCGQVKVEFGVFRYSEIFT